MGSRIIFLFLLLNVTVCWGVNLKDYAGTYRCTMLTRSTIQKDDFSIGEVWRPQVFQQVDVTVTPLDSHKARFRWKENNQSRQLEIGPFEQPETVKGFVDTQKQLRYQKVESPTMYRILEHINFASAHHGHLLDMELNRSQWRVQAQGCRKALNR